MFNFSFFFLLTMVYLTYTLFRTTCDEINVFLTSIIGAWWSHLVLDIFFFTIILLLCNFLNWFKSSTPLIRILLVLNTIEVFINKPDKFYWVRVFFNLLINIYFLIVSSVEACLDVVDNNYNSHLTYFMLGYLTAVFEVLVDIDGYSINMICLVYIFVFLYFTNSSNSYSKNFLFVVGVLHFFFLYFSLVFNIILFLIIIFFLINFLENSCTSIHCYNFCVNYNIFFWSVMETLLFYINLFSFILSAMDTVIPSPYTYIAIMCFYTVILLFIHISTLDIMAFFYIIFYFFNVVLNE